MTDRVQLSVSNSTNACIRRTGCHAASKSATSTALGYCESSREMRVVVDYLAETRERVESRPCGVDAVDEDASCDDES